MHIPRLFCHYPENTSQKNIALRLFQLNRSIIFIVIVVIKYRI